MLRGNPSGFSSGVRPSKRVRKRFSLHGTRPFHRAFWHVPVPHAVFDDECSYAELAIALVLHRDSLAFEDGTWVRDATQRRARWIQKRVGLAKQTVHTALGDLEDRGWVTVDRTGRSHRITWQLAPPTERFVQVPALFIDRLPHLPGRTAGLVFWLIVRHTLGWTVTPDDAAAVAPYTRSGCTRPKTSNEQAGAGEVCAANAYAEDACAGDAYWEWARMSLSYMADRLGRSPAAIRASIQQLHGHLIERRRVGSATEGAEFRVLPEAFSRLAHQRSAERRLARTVAPWNRAAPWNAERNAQTTRRGSHGFAQGFPVHRAFQAWMPHPLAPRSEHRIPAHLPPDAPRPNRASEPNQGVGQTPRSRPSVQKNKGDRLKTRRGVHSSYKRNSQKASLGEETSITDSASPPPLPRETPSRAVESVHLPNDNSEKRADVGSSAFPHRTQIVVQGIAPVPSGAPEPQASASSSRSEGSSFQQRLSKLSSEKQTAYTHLVEAGVYRSLSLQYVSQFSMDRLRRNAGYAIRQRREGRVENLGAYMARAIGHDYAYQKSPGEADLRALTHTEVIPKTRMHAYVTSGVYDRSCFTGAGEDSNNQPLMRYIDPTIGVRPSKAQHLLRPVPETGTS